MRLQAPTGMEDILPERMPVWNMVEENTRKVFELFGYSEIRTPALEYTSLFVRSVGEATDIVEKEMYTFDPGRDDSVTLRPELTASVVRACVEHGLFKQKSFQKLFYIGPLFRRERPQKGRLRQFHQIGAEALGSYDAMVDAEMIILAARILEGLGLKEYEVGLNSIGCMECRPKYREALKAFFQPQFNSLCENCRNRFERNVFRVLDCKAEPCVRLSANAPAIQEHLCAKCAEDFARLKELLTEAKLNFKVTPRVVRGFDYYTKTVFEITYPMLGSQNAIAGGGRYDNLIGELGGDSAGAVGFAMGIERIVLVLGQAGAANAAVPKRKAPAVHVAYIDEACKGAAFGLVRRLRADGVSSDMDFDGRSLKAQMRAANRAASRFVIVMGPDEIAKGTFKLREMATGAETELNYEGVVAAARV
jgi:histidyl-tRNA synthetase